MDKIDLDSITDDEMVSPSNRSKMLSSISIVMAEFLGTALLTFIGCMGCTLGMSSDGTSSVLQESLITGLSVMTAIQAFGHISGAHINPAVTLCGALMGHTKWNELPIYCVGQFTGALAGYALLIGVTPNEHISADGGVCIVRPHEQISVAQAILVEMLATLVLCCGICGSWHHTNEEKTDSIALKIGLMVSMLLMAAGPYTGAGMNPAKSFATAAWNKQLDTLHLVYWIGPIIGGAITGLAYKHLLI